MDEPPIVVCSRAPNAAHTPIQLLFNILNPLIRLLIPSAYVISQRSAFYRVNQCHRRRNIKTPALTAYGLLSTR